MVVQLQHHRVALAIAAVPAQGQDVHVVVAAVLNRSEMGEGDLLPFFIRTS